LAGNSVYLSTGDNLRVQPRMGWPCPECCGKRERRILSVSKNSNWLMG
jgi:hypothetical protein